jgi:hypothetical protein
VVIRLDAATVLLQWATGGWFFLWFTTRGREIGPGYGWLLRSIHLVMAGASVVAAAVLGAVPVRDAAAVGAVVAGAVALALSVVRRRDFDPRLDLVVPALGVVGLIAAGIDAAGSDAGTGTVAVSLLRVLAGAAFLGAVTDAMLLGHWYLVQPGLPRRHLNDLVRVLGFVWPVEVLAMLLPTGMLSVWVGTVSDGWNGTLGWFWGACAATTIVLVFVTRAALRERYYSAVMAATGLLYLAILTAFGTDLVARAVLAG